MPISYYDKPIIIACKEAPERLPPVLSIIKIASKVFADVIVITNKTSEQTRFELESLDVRVFEANPSQKSVKHASNHISKFKEWMKFRKKFWLISERLQRDKCIWVATVDSAFAIGRRLHRTPYILGVLELYDKQPLYLRLLKPFMQSAVHVVCPEEARSSIFRCWYHMSYSPTVIPNRPYDINCYPRMPVKDISAKTKLHQLNGRKLILYQARMVRMEAFDIAQAIQDDLGSEYVLGIMGEIRDKVSFQKLKDIYPDLIHFDYIGPPDHLAVTSHAHIGLLIYNYESLNNVFCAPNKVWEYGSVSLPMLCHELPMLSELLKYFQAGETFSTGDIGSISRAIRKIDSDYGDYAIGAKNLYESVNIEAIFCDVIEKFDRELSKRDMH